MQRYQDLPDLANIYLEDSYVLGLEATPGLLTFRMQFVLTPGHIAYAPPTPDRQYCYHDGALILRKVSELHWTDQAKMPATDAAGQKDFGNIDSLEWEDGHFVIFGDVGRLEIIRS